VAGGLLQRIPWIVFAEVNEWTQDYLPDVVVKVCDTNVALSVLQGLVNGLNPEGTKTVWCGACNDDVPEDVVAEVQETAPVVAGAGPLDPLRQLDALLAVLDVKAVLLAHEVYESVVQDLAGGEGQDALEDVSIELEGISQPIHFPVIEVSVLRAHDGIGLGLWQLALLPQEGGQVPWVSPLRVAEEPDPEYHLEAWIRGVSRG
jgi:hypothetical protein